MLLLGELQLLLALLGKPTVHREHTRIPNRRLVRVVSLESIHQAVLRFALHALRGNMLRAMRPRVGIALQAHLRDPWRLHVLIAIRGIIVKFLEVRHVLRLQQADTRVQAAPLPPLVPQIIVSVPQERILALEVHNVLIAVAGIICLQQVGPNVFSYLPEIPRGIVGIMK